MVRSTLTFIALVVVLAWPPAMAGAQVFDTKAPYALLIDFESGSVLFEKAADEPYAPASTAKLMTAEYVFHELNAGRISETDSFAITEHAWRTGGAPAGGSAMYAEVKSSVPVRDLLRGLIVQSGNDAAIALGEGIAGSEDAFAERLNVRAAEIGMHDSVFRNASGLNDPEQHVTARDMALLASAIIRTYPDYYRIFSEPEFTWNKIRQTNRNKLLGEGGVDGLKTGFIKESGYNTVVSAERNGQRLVLVIAGLKSEIEREAEARRLLNWGFSNFDHMSLFDGGEVIAEASVYGGVAGEVPLVTKAPVTVLLARNTAEPLRARVIYQGPLMAPVEEGTPAATLKVWSGERLVQESPLYTAAAVGRGTLHSRAFDALGELLFGWL